MAIVYRTDGAWGTGKGTNLVPAEVDGNFYDLDGKVTYLQENPPEAITPIAINIEGGLFTMQMSDGSTLGPIVMTMPVPQWRGDWQPATPYLEMDFFVAPDGGMGAVMLSHTSAATFDWAALSGGVPVYQEIVGASGTTAGIGDLVDVAIAAAGEGDLLIYNAAASLWQNHTPAYVATTVLPAFGGSTGSAAGLKGLVPAPAAGDDTAGKVLGAGGLWIVPPGGPGTGSLAGLADVAIVSPANLSLLQYSSVDGKWHNQTLATLGAGTVTHIDTGAGLVGGPITGTGSISLAAVATQMVMANVTGATAPPAGVSFSTLLDAVLGTARGSVLWRSASGWTALTAGVAGQFLSTGGAGGDVTWGTPSGAGTVTQVNSGTGLTGGPITATGTLSLATVSDSQVLANISGSTAAPAGTTLTLLLDHALGATQGMILYRGAASWTALAPGTSGAVLTSGGAAANPSWVTGSGAGTVTNIATGTGLIGGPITGTGTISFATVGNQTVLANISGATAAPTPSTMSAIMDAVFAATRGSVVYRGAAGWAALAPGTAGQVLTTAGASADPSWAAAAGASISIGDTAPGSPTAGAMWWDSVGGQLYLWFADGTSAQWVPVSNQPGPAGATGATGATGPTGPAGSANMSGMTAGQIPIAASATSAASSANLSGDVTSNAALAVTLATVNANVGTFQGLTLDAKGRVTAAVNQSYLTATLAATTYAPLASPVFTGNPTAPTPTAGDSDTSIATTAFVATSFAPLNAPVFTGDARAVTPATADNDTSIATTAYVQAQGYATSAAMTTADNLRVLKAGDTMGGSLTLSVGDVLTATGSLIANATIPSPPVYVNSLYGGSFNSVGQVLGFNDYVDNALTHRARTTGYAHQINADGSGQFAVFISSASVTAGAVPSFTARLVVNGVSGACTNTSGTWAAISDASLKDADSIRPYERGLDAILALEPVYFTYNGKGGLTGDHFGLIADQVEMAVPEVIGEVDLAPGPDSGSLVVKTVDPGRLIYALINAVRELSAKVAALEGKPA